MFGRHQHMRMEMRMEMCQTLRQIQDLEEEALALYEEYANRLVSRRIIPTLDGPRVMLYHTALAPEIRTAWHGERFAGGINDTAFVSDRIPRVYLRYALVYVYHLSTDWCLAPSRQMGGMTEGPPVFRALEVELGLARVELWPEEYDRYWEVRKVLGPIGFFKRSRRLVDASRCRIDAIADRFEMGGVRRGLPWKLDDDLAAYRRTAPINYAFH